MTSPPRPSPGEAVAHLAVQLSALRGQIRRLTKRLDQAGITDASDRPDSHPAPRWTGLADQDRETQLTALREWVDTILRTEYGGYQLATCWDRHPQAVWELSTLAAEWHRTYDTQQPSLDEALKFYDRWLPGTMRRVAEITSRCRPECTQARGRRPGGTAQQ